MHPYDTAHKKARAQALLALIDGTPCPICHTPMYRTQYLDYDHVIPLRLGGAPDGVRRLTHRYCNRHNGMLLGIRMRGKGGRRKPRNARTTLPKW